MNPPSSRSPWQPVLAPLGHFYALLTNLRNKTYDKNLRSVEQVSRPVVSIGNISVGGTGKTPLIDHLVGWARERDLKVGIVSRGYGGNFTGEQEVVAVENSQTESAGRSKGIYFGDEPMMLADKYSPVTPVFVGKKKVRVCKKLLKEFPQTQIIFADDAFQHRALKRDLDIVVLDMTESLVDCRLIPEGRLRETVTGLARADHLVMTKVNLVSPAVLADQKKMLTDLFANMNVKLPDICECLYGIAGLRSLAAVIDPSSSEDINEGLGSALAQIIDHHSTDAAVKLGLISGIARPELFLRMFESEFNESLVPCDNKVNFNIIQHYEFRDHFNYKKKDIEDVLKSAKDLGIAALFLTSKDAIKWKAFDLDYQNVFIVDLGLKWQAGVNKLYGKISSLIM